MDGFCFPTDRDKGGIKLNSGFLEIDKFQTAANLKTQESLCFSPSSASSLRRVGFSDWHCVVVSYITQRSYTKCQQ
jgi:hypothetical protein